MQFLRDFLLVRRAKIFSVLSRRISQPGNQRPVLRALLRYVPRLEEGGLVCPNWSGCAGPPAGSGPAGP